MEIAGYIVLGIMALGVVGFVLQKLGINIVESFISLLWILFLGVAWNVFMFFYDWLIRGTIIELILSSHFAVAFFGALLWMFMLLCRGDLGDDAEHTTVANQSQKPSPQTMPSWEVGLRMAGGFLVCLCAAIFFVATCCIIFS